jgi:hypothetical protein
MMPRQPVHSRGPYVRPRTGPQRDCRRRRIPREMVAAMWGRRAGLVSAAACAAGAGPKAEGGTGVAFSRYAASVPWLSLS